MIEELKQIKLEDMAESMRHIVEEEENADAHDNSAAQSRVQHRRADRRVAAFAPRLEPPGGPKRGHGSPGASRHT